MTVHRWTTPRSVATLDRYWSIFAVDPGDVDAVVATVFTPGAQLESAALPDPVVGHDAITDRMHAIRTALDGATIRHVTEVEWSHRTARWCWVIGTSVGTRRGMDVVRLTDDGTQIELLVVFSGLLPPPS